MSGNVYIRLDRGFSNSVIDCYAGTVIHVLTLMGTCIHVYK